MSSRATDGKLREGGDPAYIFVCILPKPSGYSGPGQDDLGWEEKEEDEALGSSPNHFQIMLSCSRKAIHHIQNIIFISMNTFLKTDIDKIVYLEKDHNCKRHR